MAELYLEMKADLKFILPMVNPLPVIVDLSELISLNSDLTNINLELKCTIRREYRHWCRSIHPDKVTDVDEQSIHIYREFGEAFLRFEDNENDTIWTYIGFAAHSFQDVDIDVLKLSDICRLIRDTQVLRDIVNQCDKLSEETGQLIDRVRSDLESIKTHIISMESTAMKTLSMKPSTSTHDYEMNEEERNEEKNIRYHRKRLNPRRISIPHNTWIACVAETVDTLPYNIDGLSKYILSFDVNNRMKSSKDGRNWNAWVTSSRVGFIGVRRVASCGGGMRCVNDNCTFKRTYKKENSFHFRKTIDAEIVCKLCLEVGEKVQCKCFKIWEFDDSTFLVTVYHHGDHNCAAKVVLAFDEDRLKKKFTKSSATPEQVKRDVLMSCIGNPDVDEVEFDKMMDSMLDKQKMNNFKAKCQNERRPYGHSFEAVSDLRELVRHLDPFYIFMLNDRKFNGEVSYVFKTSRTQLELALQMDKDSGGPLSEEYVYFDGTFKRCPQYTTLTAHVYLQVINRIVKLFTMETEDEGTECVTKCWEQFNRALREYTGDPNKTFNPTGWVMDEAAGFWSALKIAFGSSASERSVSCEWHFSQSVKSQSKFIRTSKSDFINIGNNILLASHREEYEQALLSLERFIEENLDERKFLYNWIAWWDQRKTHFVRAFKNASAPNTNLSECYNSKYVTTRDFNLKLVDAARSDILLAKELDRALKRFGEGVAVNGRGPSSSQRMGRDYREQKKRARQYAEEVTLNHIAVNDQNGGNYNEADEEKRRNSWRQKSKGKLPKRSERYRSTKSKTFMRSFNKAKENCHNYVHTYVEEVSPVVRKHKVKHYNNEFDVVIQERPSCTCNYFVRANERFHEICAHIIWVYLYYYKLTENNPIIYQVALTSQEIRTVFSFAPDIVQSNNVVNSPSCSNKLTDAEERGIFEANEKNKNQVWKIGKLFTRKNARCSSCKAAMPAGKLFIQVDGLYIPPKRRFAVERRFYFCASFDCVKRVNSSNLIPASKDTEFILTEESQLSDEDFALLKSRGFSVLLP